MNNYNGNNVHVYNSIPTQPSQRPDFALGSPSVDYNTLAGMNYVQNPVVAVEGDRLVVSSDFERKTPDLDGAALNDLAFLEFVFALGEDGDLVLVNPEDSPAELPPRIRRQRGRCSA